MTDICLSGGAKGADTLFGELALEAGHGLKHYIFQGHNSKCSHTVKLSSELLFSARPYVIEANKILKRTYPGTNPYVNSVLERNFFQVLNSHCIYAIVYDIKKIQGTMWALVMGAQLGISDIYVFNSVDNSWYEYSLPDVWIKCSTAPPKPCYIYTGIGSRELTENGIAAARALYK
jgi:hypothetical protein